MRLTHTLAAGRNSAGGDAGTGSDQDGAVAGDLVDSRAADLADRLGDAVHAVNVRLAQLAAVRVEREPAAELNGTAGEKRPGLAALAKTQLFELHQDVRVMLPAAVAGLLHAHHNPMDEWEPERTGRYRPVVPKRIPRAIPDGWFDKLFASLPSDRDRALVAFWISTGARAAELLGMRQCDCRPGEQLISVVRKGTRAVQELPASADAFVWHRLYQQELLSLGVPRAGGSRRGGRCGAPTGR